MATRVDAVASTDPGGAGYLESLVGDRGGAERGPGARRGDRGPGVVCVGVGIGGGQLCGARCQLEQPGRVLATQSARS